MKALSLKPLIVMRRGKPVSVILTIAAYERLLERLGNAEDAVAMKEAQEKPQSFRPLSEYLAERKARHA